MKDLIDNEDIELDNQALKLFGVHYLDLKMVQQERVYDELHPQWKVTTARYGEPVEISNTGLARDPITKAMYKIYFPVYSNGVKTYQIITIPPSKERKGYPYPIHRMVAKAFVDNPNPETKICVNHIDGNRTNSWYKNLEWVTYAENTQHAVRTGLMKQAEEHPNALYTNDQVKQVCELLRDHPDWTYFEIEEATGVRWYTTGQIYEGGQWTEVSKEYLPFPPRQTVLIYTEDQVRQACELLRDRPDLTFEKVGELTGLADTAVNDIYRRRVRKDISKDYVFPERDTQIKGEKHPLTKYPKSKVEEVCNLLDKVYTGQIKMNQFEIAKQVGASYDFVHSIQRGHTWVDVAKNHIFYKMKFHKED